jgi:hypothetical protein
VAYAVPLRVRPRPRRVHPIHRLAGLVSQATYAGHINVQERERERESKGNGEKAEYFCWLPILAAACKDSLHPGADMSTTTYGNHKPTSESCGMKQDSVM